MITISRPALARRRRAAGGTRGRRSLTLQLLLRLPELLQLGKVLVEYEHLGKAERGHGGRRARITLRGRAALCRQRRLLSRASLRTLPAPRTALRGALLPPALTRRPARPQSLLVEPFNPFIRHNFKSMRISQLSINIVASCLKLYLT